MRCNCIVMVCLPTLMSAAFGQVQDPKATVAPPAEVPRAESLEHKFARTALEDMTAKAASMQAEFNKLHVVYDCLLVKSDQVWKTATFRNKQCALTPKRR